MTSIHSVVAHRDHFRCLACGFIGDLAMAIKHVVTNQFVVKG